MRYLGFLKREVELRPGSKVNWGKHKARDMTESSLLPPLDVLEVVAYIDDGSGRNTYTIYQLPSDLFQGRLQALEDLLYN